MFPSRLFSVPLTTALLMAVSPAIGHAAVTRFAVGSTPAAMAISGDGLVVLSDQIHDGTLSAVRLAPGQPAQAIAMPDLVVGAGQFDSVGGPIVQASATALALSARDFEVGNRSYVGPAAGPMRRVSRCTSPNDDSSLPVAVDGSRVAWIEGGCATGREAYGAATVVIGDADPALPTRRIPLPAGAHPQGLSLAAAGDRVSYATKDRTLIVAALTPADGLSTLLTQDNFADTALAGVGSDGATFLASTQALHQADGCEDQVQRLAPGMGALARFPSAGCLTGGDEDASPVALGGDRIVTLAIDKGSKTASPKLVVLNAPLSGGPATRLLRATRRLPSALTADASRFAYAVPSCSSGQDVSLVIADTQQPPLAQCSLRLTGKTLRRTTTKRASIAATCPLGCRVTTRVKNTFESDSFKGAGRVNVELPKGTKTGATVSVKFEVDQGATVVRKLRVTR